MNDREDPLTRSAGALPRDIQPERDLWPDIAWRLNRPAVPGPPRRRAHWPAAVAAGLALVALSSAATWWLLQRDSIATDQLVELMTPATDPLAGDAAMLELRRTLADTLDRSLQRLSPETRRQVTANLVEIHQGLAAIRVALEQDPNNTFLHQLLYTTWEQELELLSDINKLALTVPDEVEI